GDAIAVRWARPPSAAAPSPARRGPPAGRLRLRATRLEQLHRVAGGVVRQDLPAPDPDDDVAAEPDPGSAEPVDGGVEVVDLDLEPVPAARSGDRAVRHRLAAASGAAGGAVVEAEVVPGQHGERRRRMHDLPETGLVAVEGEGGVDNGVGDAEGGRDGR